MPEALERWRNFPREIRCDLSLFHHRHIREWLQGEMSSSELLDLLDGLMLHESSWYRHSVIKYFNEKSEEQEDEIVGDVRSLIYAQLHGQKIEVSGDG